VEVAKKYDFSVTNVSKWRRHYELYPYVEHLHPQ
jgi:hypothetical protein